MNSFSDSERIISISEHELRNVEGRLNYDRLSSLLKGSQIVMSFNCGEGPEVRNSLISIANNLPGELRILIYEECIEKGGGGEGILPTLIEVSYRSFLFVAKAGAAALISKIGADVYKELKHKIFRTIFGLKAKGGCVFRLTTDRRNVIEYLFYNSMSADDALFAFQELEKHFPNLNGDRYLKNMRFAFDKEAGKWIPID